MSSGKIASDAHSNKVAASFIEAVLIKSGAANAIYINWRIQKYFFQIIYQFKAL